ncbi:hypothetical protein E2542_SST24932 [Spatholobus suberectus]|nr:hypothetical protein E2542_SST24932 [Spatholobus suberectus]
MFRSHHSRPSGFVLTGGFVRFLFSQSGVLFGGALLSLFGLVHAHRVVWIIVSSNPKRCNLFKQLFPNGILDLSLLIYGEVHGFSSNESSQVPFIFNSNFVLWFWLGF